MNEQHRGLHGVSLESLSMRFSRKLINRFRLNNTDFMFSKMGATMPTEDDVSCIKKICVCVESAQ